MLTTHNGRNCPYCQLPIKQESETVQCRSCKALHHQECWKENGGCTTFGCQETSFRTPAGKSTILVSGGPESERYKRYYKSDLIVSVQ